VLVYDNNVISTGYNGSLPKQPHCTDVQCDMVPGHCVRSVHAEANALYQAAKLGKATRGALAYVTHAPCWRCTQSLIAAGVTTIIYINDYRRDIRVQRVIEAELVTFMDVEEAEVEQP
jgi:dCMP deaminase